MTCLFRQGREPMYVQALGSQRSIERWPDLGFRFSAVAEYQHCERYISVGQFGCGSRGLQGGGNQRHPLYPLESSPTGLSRTRLILPVTTPDRERVRNSTCQTTVMINALVVEELHAW